MTFFFDEDYHFSAAAAGSDYSSSLVQDGMSASSSFVQNPGISHPVSWNVYRYIGDFLHLFGMIVMVLTLFKNQSLIGFSIKTSVAYLVLYCCRYLDLLTRIPSFYLLFFKVTYISTSAVPVLLYFKWKGTYERRKDTVNIVAFFMGAFILAIFTADSRQVIPLLWTFSQYLEAIALIPQYVFCYREPDKSEPGIVLFIIAIGLYRVFYACNWIYKKMAVSSYSDVHSWIAGFFEIMFFIDFLLHHFQGFSFLKTAVLGVDNQMKVVSDAIEFQVLGTTSKQRDEENSLANKLKGGYDGIHSSYTADQPDSAVRPGDRMMMNQV